MYWTLRFVSVNHTPDERVIELCEVYYDDDNTLMGFAKPCLLGESHLWPITLAKQVAKAAALPVLTEEEFY